MQKNIIFIIIKGMCVGGTMLVPGISGGSMAMVLGIYDKLVSSVSSFARHKKESILFLGIFSIGSILGMILFANPLLYLIKCYPMPMLYFFIGVVAGGIPMIHKKAEIERVSWKVLFYPVLGVISVVLFSMIPADTFQSNMKSEVVGFLLLIIAGVFAAVALILPGISVSYMLLLMGMYDKTMRAISDFYIPFLVPLGIGLILGIVSTTKMLEQSMIRYPQTTYLTILGFILGSMVEVFPGFPSGTELIICMFMTLSGFVIIQLLSLVEMKK